MLDRSTIMLCITALSLAACASDGERVADAGSSDTVTPTTSAGSVGETSLETGSTTMPGGSSSAADSSSSAASEDTAGTDEGAQDEIVPEFALLDLNPTSATFEQTVSPRDYLSQASGWYFTHAT